MTNVIQHRIADAKRIVIKIGSSLLVENNTGTIHRKWLASLVNEIVQLLQQQKEIIIVSSGAIPLGRRHLQFKHTVLQLKEKQAAAATGQIKLAHAYQAAFEEHGITVAQVLLTLDDSENRTRCLNAKNTLETLLNMHAIPVINENDTVATDEIRFGDNDKLAARVAQMISADTLVLLSDIEGLYTANPQIDSTAKLIPEVKVITPEISAMAGDSATDYGSGGMITKLAAAKIALASGCRMVIAAGKHFSPLGRIDQVSENTWFIPETTPAEARKNWIAHHLELTSVGESARQSSRALALATTEEKNKALQLMANAIRLHSQEILFANQNDLNLAKQKELPASFLDRLALDAKRIEAMASGLEVMAELPDPIGTILAEIDRPNKLKISRVRVPIGVIGVIYESRPNVTADAAGLCLKSGNAVILRCGSESFQSSSAIMSALRKGIDETNIPVNALQMVPTNERTALDEMLTMDKYIDVIIPRGGMKLMEHVSSHSRIPVLKHLAGICHTYIHHAADKDMARKIILNAKMRRTGICGATEVLLIDRAAMMLLLPDILNDLHQAGCEIRGDNEIININSHVKLADSQDYNTEFLDAIIAVKVVEDVADAIAHIAQHGTQHTEAIVTEDISAAEKFLKEVDSAIVMHNTSTQFADGGEFGMGGEIGIATGKLHARGPVGVEQLTTFKYVVHGNGQVRS